jgi:hypothetical protein
MHLSSCADMHVQTQTCLARIQRDKAVTVQVAFSAAGQAVMKAQSPEYTANAAAKVVLLLTRILLRQQQIQVRSSSGSNCRPCANRVWNGRTKQGITPKEGAKGGFGSCQHQHHNMNSSSSRNKMSSNARTKDRSVDDNQNLILPVYH